MLGRYDTSGFTEDQYEPGSHKKVLKNLLHIHKKKEMDREEALAHAKTLKELVRIYGQSHRFTEKDILRIHKIWMGPIYPWAGTYRSVKITKEGFPFAYPGEIPRLMAEFEKNVLSKYTPCRFKSVGEMIRAIAIVHTELVLIHPFREGNGRLARLLSVLMAFQAGLPTLDFGGIKGRKKNEYIYAVQSGMSKNYTPMRKIFGEVIERSIKHVSQKG